MSTIIKCKEINNYVNTYGIYTMLKKLIMIDNDIPLNFISKNIHKNYGKFLFNNGIYDAVTRIFTKSYDLNMVFTNKIHRNFVKKDTLSQEIYDEINNELFATPFLNSSNNENYGFIIKYILARALHGGFVNDKLIYSCIGDKCKNIYKNIHNFITVESFGEYVKKYNPAIFKSCIMKRKIMNEFDYTRLALSCEYYDRLRINNIFLLKLLSNNYYIKSQTPTFIIMSNYAPIICNTIKSSVKTVEYPILNTSETINNDIDVKYKNNLGKYVNYYFYIITDLMYQWNDPPEIQYPELPVIIKDENILIENDSIVNKIVDNRDLLSEWINNNLVKLENTKENKNKKVSFLFLKNIWIVNNLSFNHNKKNFNYFFKDKLEKLGYEVDVGQEGKSHQKILFCKYLNNK
jgi:hypothetical protein